MPAQLFHVNRLAYAGYQNAFGYSEIALKNALLRHVTGPNRSTNSWLSVMVTSALVVAKQGDWTGLVYADKTTYMAMSRDENTEQSHNANIDSSSF